MIGYWILLLITAFIAYTFGSVSTLSIASVFVFHQDLHRIGKKRMFISNFRRLYGYKGFLKLLEVGFRYEDFQFDIVHYITPVDGSS